jgi:chromosome partitioning protein
VWIVWRDGAFALEYLDMKMLGVLSRKGGVGKTTLAIHMAVLADQAGLRTLLVDLDPQRSAASWWRARAAETPHLVETDPGNLRDILVAAAEDGVALVVVDARPSLEADAAHVAALADLVLVPTRPAIFDLRAILGTLDIVKGTARRSLIVLNACPPPRGAGEASVVVDARHALAAFGVPVAPVAIVNRTAFSGAAVDGLTACEADPFSKAAKEMRALWRTVEKELNVDGKAKPAKRPGAEGGTGTGARRTGREAAQGA